MEKGKKIAIICLILFIMILSIVGTGYLFGFVSLPDSSNDWESEWEKKQQMKSEFEIAMESVVSDFVEESSGHNFDTSQAEKDYILNYDENQFKQHRSLIYNNDDFCGYDDTYGYQWTTCRDYVIDGLQSLVYNDFVGAYESFLFADNQILMTDYMGDYWYKQFGFEEGICDILWDMGYRLKL